MGSGGLVLVVGVGEVLWDVFLVVVFVFFGLGVDGFFFGFLVLGIGDF